MICNPTFQEHAFIRRWISQKQYRIDIVTMEYNTCSLLIGTDALLTLYISYNLLYSYDLKWSQNFHGASHILFATAELLICIWLWTTTTIRWVYLFTVNSSGQVRYRNEYVYSLLIHQDRLDAGMNTSIHQMAKDRQTPHHGIVGRSHRIVRQKQGICNLLVFYVPFAVLWAWSFVVW